MTETADLPQTLTEIVEDFHAVSERERLELLLELSRELPELPETYGGNYHEQMEQVVECQSPLFLAVEYDDDANTAQLIFSAPAEAPTTRGFASILQQGLSGLTYQQILDVPDDLHQRMGLAKAITPLRLRGMSAMLGRVKHNIRQHQGQRAG
ncbi:SufE family protein [Garicola koreensis]|uniref:Cysteine desulfuration protein SufE n=1 Tax=Garicola koreensis TaxID=1262554 RepID=A0A7W5XJZ6_9MICC|nr:SufE family protein [Garicola koreensis]MBB3666932.1 cysteine desulfuration protein SufE [Garicola koreensis]